MMQVAHKIIDNRYHHVRALGYHHLYAQWPVGMPLARDQVSHGLMPMSEETLEKFRETAQKAADAATR